VLAILRKTDFQFVLVDILTWSNLRAYRIGKRKNLATAALGKTNSSPNPG